MRKIYIAAPYTLGDPIANTQRVIEMAERIYGLGMLPWVPHITMLWHLISPHEPDFWYEYDNQWLRHCDAVLRMPGESVGADNEVKLAKELGIPAHYSILELYGWFLKEKIHGHRKDQEDPHERSAPGESDTSQGMANQED